MEVHNCKYLHLAFFEEQESAVSDLEIRNQSASGFGNPNERS